MHNSYLKRVKDSYFTDGISIFFVKTNKFNSSGFLMDYRSPIDSLRIVEVDNVKFGEDSQTVQITESEDEKINLQRNFITLAFRLDGVSLDGFNVLDDGYATFRNKVYCENKELPEADIKTFSITKTSDRSGRKGYAKDKNNVYLNRCKVENADPKTFVILDEEFSKDKNYVFFHNKIIIDATPSTFKIINEAYQKDSDHVWYRGQLMEADVITFERIPNSSYSRDKNHVFFQNEILKKADPKSFRLEETSAPYINYGIDKYHVYYSDELLEDADAKTFQVVKDESRKWDAFDKKNRYIRNEKVK